MSSRLETVLLEDGDQTAVLRGLASAVMISAPIWCLVACLGSWLLS